MAETKRTSNKKPATGGKSSKSGNTASKKSSKAAEILCHDPNSRQKCRIVQQRTDQDDHKIRPIHHLRFGRSPKQAKHHLPFPNHPFNLPVR